MSPAVKYEVWETMHLFLLYQINMKGNANKNVFPFNTLTSPTAFIY